ncbi:hypothetical protein Tco_0467974 [Tanacetum coccineum]
MKHDDVVLTWVRISTLEGWLPSSTGLITKQNQYFPTTSAYWIEEDYKDTGCREFIKKLLIKNVIVLNLRGWSRVFITPTMVPNSKKLIEVFIGGLPQSIEGNVTASKPQTLEEATNIAQRLMDQQNIRIENLQGVLRTSTPMKTVGAIKKFAYPTISDLLLMLNIQQNTILRYRAP